ncbi:glycosyltransferase [Rhodovarius crocodyli]|uniref:Glycosyltransferase n=1 Tax=Rhodovarius crocodyli TaxID=1979269 RepID=A0A437MH63_9PROT|nr:glycosyltransferase [Rhodovarius crocodyli]RVT96994.1 glycosyltransferase [Rhodovarius crocodyli]
MRIAYCTICSSNYLAYARTLHASLRAAGEDAPFFLFLADEVSGRFDASLLGFPCIETRDLPIPNHFDMAMRYSVMEMNTAVKPFALDWLMEEQGFDAVVYLDPDILVQRPLAHVHAALEQGAEMVLTPHLLAPLDDDFQPDDIAIMRSGTYNLGFCAFRRTPGARALLGWWARQLETRCIVDLKEGLFVDQRFMDMAPGFVAGTAILRHPGYNLAYWNLAHRPVTEGQGGYLAAGEPLHFTHFSGVVPGERGIFSKHQNRFGVAELGGLTPIFHAYHDALLAHAELGGVEVARLPYAYGALANGVAVSGAMRRVYGALRQGGATPYAAAFDADLSPWVTLAPGIGAPGIGAPGIGAPITRLMAEFHDKRPDLQRVFPLTTPEGREGYAAWFAEKGFRESGTPAPLVARHAALARPQPGRAERPPGLDIHGYLRAESGLGAAVRRQVMAARAAGIPGEAFSLPAAQFDDAVVPPFPIATQNPRHDCALFHINADRAVNLPSEVAPDRLAGRYRIGFWAWELSRLPDAWMGAFDHLDEVWAPSEFSARAFARRTAKPVRVMPNVVEMPPILEKAQARAALALPAEPLLFLTGFDAHSFMARKNPMGAVRAFLDAFPPGPDSPQLVVKCLGRGDMRALQELAARDARLHLIERVLTPAEVTALQGAVDGFISLHRSEGFGLWLAECMAQGLPVLATGYSGNMDYMTPGNSMPIPFELVRVGPGEYPEGSGQWWAEPDHDAAVAGLRALASDAALRARLGEAAREAIRAHSSAEAVGARMAARLAEIRSEA